MFTKVIVAFTLVVVLTSHMTAAHQPGQIQTVVDAFYPLTLEPEDEEQRRSCHEVLRSNASGEAELIVAGYTDMVGGAIRLLKRSEQGFEVVSEGSTNLAMLGTDCVVTPMDFDGAGLPEILLTMRTSRGEIGWIFAFGGDLLTLVSPTSVLAGRTETLLSGFDIVDVTHSGGAQVYLPPALPNDESNRSAAPGVLYSLSGASFTIHSVVVCLAQFRNEDSALSRESECRLVEGDSGTYSLRLINGARNGEKRANGVSVSLNGVTVAGLDNFNETVEFLDVPLTNLLDRNDLKVIVGGPADAEVVAIVTKQGS